MQIEEIVKHYRETHKLSTRRFAELCDLTCGYISMLENGKNPNTGKPIAPTLGTFKKLARGMGMSLDELILMIGDNQLVSLATHDDLCDISTYPLSPHEHTVITAYRDQPEMQPAVDRLLSVPPQVVPISAAATGSGPSPTSATFTDEQLADTLDTADVDEHSDQ